MFLSEITEIETEIETIDGIKKDVLLRRANIKKVRISPWRVVSGLLYCSLTDESNRKEILVKWFCCITSYYK